MKLNYFKLLSSLLDRPTFGESGLTIGRYILILSEGDQFETWFSRQYYGFQLSLLANNKFC